MGPVHGLACRQLHRRSGRVREAAPGLCSHGNWAHNARDASSHPRGRAVEPHLLARISTDYLRPPGRSTYVGTLSRRSRETLLARPAKPTAVPDVRRRPAPGAQPGLAPASIVRKCTRFFPSARPDRFRPGPLQSRAPFWSRWPNSPFRRKPKLRPVQPPWCGPSVVEALSFLGHPRLPAARILRAPVEFVHTHELRPPATVGRSTARGVVIDTAAEPWWPPDQASGDLTLFRRPGWPNGPQGAGSSAVPHKAWMKPPRDSCAGPPGQNFRQAGHTASWPGAGATGHPVSRMAPELGVPPPVAEPVEPEHKPTRNARGAVPAP